MELEIERKFFDCRMLWMDGKTAYLARGMRFWGISAGFKHMGCEHTLGNRVERMLAWFRLTRQLFRVGVHHLWPLPGGGFLVVVRKRAYRIDSAGRAKIALRFPRGNKPARSGVCVTPDGSIFLGEYAQNLKRTMPVVLYRSDDSGRSFAPILAFGPGEVRHIHFIQWDPIGHCLWLGTGDADNESRLYRSTDNGMNWKKIGGGSQLWRAVGVSIRSDALYWGTDAGSDAGDQPNYVVRLDRKTMALKKVLKLQGPCHGNAMLKNGTLLVSTGVEGGQNEKDRYAHLWASRDGKCWEEVISFKKDPFPKILQFGVIRFPYGLDQRDQIIFTCLGLTGAGETTFVGRLK